MSEAAVPRVALNLIRGCLIATIPFDLPRPVLEQFRRDLLARLAASRATRVILDCSGIEILDADDFEGLRRTTVMAALLGARTVLVGLQPGVVSALVELNVPSDGLETALGLDEAFALLEPAAGEGGEDDRADGGAPADDRR